MKYQKSQSERILALLKRKRYVSVPELMKLGISCYTKRISELRKKGYKIINIKKYNKKTKTTESTYKMWS
uniref:Putative DNA binding, helix-turn-helix domain containing protein n=1 Tax=viral metagenome TaxID=1070528 RepID=A0A6M3JBL1_9ZZZZ